MTTINIKDFQTDLVHHLNNAANGEPLTILRAGEPFVTGEAAKTAVSAVPADTTQRLGFLKGQFTIPDDFDTFLQTEILKMFEGRPDKFADTLPLLASGKPR